MQKLGVSPGQVANGYDPIFIELGTGTSAYVKKVRCRRSPQDIPVILSADLGYGVRLFII